MSNNTAKRGPPKKDSTLELAKMMDATVKVKCLGGRELQGVLRGYDDLVNLVLDDCEEYLRGKLYDRLTERYSRCRKFTLRYGASYPLDTPSQLSLSASCCLHYLLQILKHMFLQKRQENWD